MPRRCLWCAEKLVRKPGPGRWPYYCTPTCSALARQDGQRVLRQPARQRRGRCRWCADVITRCGQARYCSKACQSQASYDRNREAIGERFRERYTPVPATKWCENCGAPVKNRPDIRFCTKADCKRRANRERMRAYYPRVDWNRYRKPEHAARARANQRAKGYSDAQRARDQRRRARQVGAPVEEFSRAEVFARCGWRCGICGEPVDASLAHPDPMSASLDHVVPLSRGGPHASENVRLAHLSCNVRRGNRLEVA